jgi:hypothetical protein
VFGCTAQVALGSGLKRAPRALPGRFLGFDRTFSSGVVLTLLNSGHVTQSQTVEFDDVPHFSAPVLLAKEPASVDAAVQGEEDDSDDEVELQISQLPSALPPAPVTAVQPLVPAAAALPPGELSSRPVATQPQTWPGRPVHAT